jgi:hypothetical protein
LAGVTECPANKRCPCGSRKRYRQCCKKKKFRWIIDEEGNFFKEIPLNKEAIEILQQMRDKFKATFGRNPADGDFVFPLTYTHSEDELNRDILDAMRQAGVRPEIIYAYSKTERIVTEDNMDKLSESEWREWCSAIDEYSNRQPMTIKPKAVSVPCLSISLSNGTRCWSY